MARNLRRLPCVQKIEAYGSVLLARTVTVEVTMQNEQSQNQERRRHYRSLFWPFVLIGIGVVWLLTNLGIVPESNLAILWRLWPLLLVVIGLDLIFGRLSPVAGAVIGIVAVGVVVAILIAGPALGLTPAGGTFFGVPIISLGNADVKTERFSEPLGNATAAQVSLGLGREPATVKALSDSSDLIDATLTHVGEIDFRVSGDGQKSVTLRHRDIIGTGWVNLGAQQLHWDVGLTPAIPLDLRVDSGSGSVQLDLAGITLNRLVVDSGSGSVVLALPAGDGRYPAELDSGSGSITMNIADGATVDLRLNSGSGSVSLRIGRDVTLDASLDSGSGSVSIDAPADAAMRLEVRERASGNVNVPVRMRQASGGERGVGTWETSDYASATRRINVVVTDRGSGSINLR